MSFWEKLVHFVSQSAGNVLSGVVEAVRTLFEGDPETRRQVAFSVSLIALSAKMAKAKAAVPLKEKQKHEGKKKNHNTQIGTEGFDRKPQ